MIWLVTALLGGVVLYLLAGILSRRQSYWKDRGFPYVPAYPLIGNFQDILMKRKTMIEFTTDLYKRFKNEKYVGYLQLQSPVLLVRDPDLANQIITKDFGHFHDRGMPQSRDYDPLSANLVNLTGDQWRSMRHRLTPTFTSGKLKMMFVQIAQCADSAVEYIGRQKGQQDARAVTSKFSLSVIAAVAFGLKMDAFNDEDAGAERFTQMSGRFFSQSYFTVMKLFFRMSFPNVSHLLRLRSTDDDVNQFFVGLIKDTIDFRESSGTKRNDFLQMLLDIRHQQESRSNGKPLTNGAVKVHSNGSTPAQTEYTQKTTDDVEDGDKILMEQLKNVEKYSPSKELEFTDNVIAANSFIFVSGGSETIAAVMQFALFHLARNPDVQARVQEEIDSVLSTQDFDYKAVKSMTSVTNVLHETLRLHPPGGLLMRQCTEDWTIPGTNKVVEKGAVIGVPALGFHLDPQYFPDPEAFKPDRFRNNMEDIPKGVYFPFGGGPRICIAMRLAMLEMEVVLAKLLRHYTLTLGTKTKVPLTMAKNSLTQHVEGGIWVNFKERLS